MPTVNALPGVNAVVSATMTGSEMILPSESFCARAVTLRTAAMKIYVSLLNMMVG
jgi:hypothetical protein